MLKYREEGGHGVQYFKNWNIIDITLLTNEYDDLRYREEGGHGVQFYQIIYLLDFHF
jgi:hypothetical protein